MSEKKIKYNYAYIDNTEKVVNINDICNDENRKNHTYMCLSCGKEMVSACGKKMKPHFRHKEDENCDPNRYIHTLAEKLFKQRFDSNMPLYINLDQKVKCSEAERCKYYSPSLDENIDKDGCRHRINRRCNLKDYYDTCSLEKGIDGYVADILLEDSKGTHKPFLIEIFVTHKCSPEKMKSGLRIIEIKIDTEQNAQSLLTCDALWGDIYNFYIPEKRVLLHNTFDIDIFHLYKSSKLFIDKGKRKCRDIVYTHNESAVFESLINSYDTISLFKCAIDNGIKVRNCHMCMFYKDTLYGEICCRYKTKGTPHTPKYYFANICPYFKRKCIPNDYNQKILYIEKDEEAKDLISIYKKKYCEDVMQPMNKCRDAFDKNELCFIFNDKQFNVKDYYDSCSRVINEEKCFYSIVFSNTKKQGRNLHMVFVRQNEYLRNLNNKERTIYVYNEVIHKNDNKICIVGGRLDSNFFNFEVKVPEVNTESDVVQETKEEEKPLLLDIDKCQNILLAVLERFKRLYDENNLKLKLFRSEEFNIKDKYPYCKVNNNPENLYYSLVFNEKDEFLRNDLTINFVYRRHSYHHDSKMKEIIIYIDEEDEDVLKDNCIIHEINKILFYNF